MNNLTRTALEDFWKEMSTIVHDKALVLSYDKQFGWKVFLGCEISSEDALEAMAAFDKICQLAKKK